MSSLITSNSAPGKNAVVVYAVDGSTSRTGYLTLSPNTSVKDVKTAAVDYAASHLSDTWGSEVSASFGPQESVVICSGE